MTISVPDLTLVEERQQQTWASGDFSRVATGQVLVSELLCEAVDIRAGQRVLDVATGSGNTALAAARRFCDVTAIDWVPALLERGRERAAAERLSIVFAAGNAESIPEPAESFDVVLSTFGAMFAADQEQAASELVRTCRPGGKVGMANWTPDGWVGELFRATSVHVAPPAGLNSPLRWGTEAGLDELLGPYASSLQVTPRTFVFRFKSAEHWLDLFRTYYGPTRRAFEALDGTGKRALARDLTDVLRWFNRSDDETIVVPGDYLEVVAIRR